ncbi:ketosteroid isomerase-like protein [Paenibacillus sp. BK033]|uniref:nuclear transport factor 2 family protein n=1 Tax=Paenibacillus sp. BK033 TaxID=2512133 RepID=UPI00105241E2|nr:nuclear transport factor 2 family protein [Paenibacillus sp. BK033]TCM90708.1 ketosteroid isomerase-like protein [Paenibacillus sp. BK033]
MHKSAGTGISRTHDAFDAFKHAFETGKTEDFLQKVTEDFRFRVPLPLEGWDNEQYGKERFEDLIRFERSVLQVYLTSTIVLENEDNGMVVFRAEGMLTGKPYHNELIVVFEYEEDRIRSFREYVGTPLKNYEAP